MKIIKTVFIFIFIICLLVPLVFFNFTPNSISEIDNRKLTENPFLAEAEGDLTKNIENYVNDRIGFRDDMILGYTLLNDKLFGKMVHPSYVYGKDGYVFGSGITTQDLFSDFHVAFADMVLKLQEYCEARDVPFLFVFNPAKPAIFSDKLAAGVNYNRSWVEKFLSELDKRGINYIDNTKLLKDLCDEGIMTFNQKYDANHWNYTGAFYGTQNMLKALSERADNIHINDIDEFEYYEDLKTSLLVSDFPINEKTPNYSPILDYKNITSLYSNEIQLHKSYKAFGYYENSTRKAEGAANALVFQGSYMNSYGTKFCANAFSEYVHVHDYQNVLELPYYFNIFKPDCVIFEVAEYTFSNNYFNYENMLKLDYNEPLKNFDTAQKNETELVFDTLSIETGNTLTKINWQSDTLYDSVWFIAGDEYDMLKTSAGYTVTIKTDSYNEHKENLKIVTHKNGEICIIS